MCPSSLYYDMITYYNYDTSCIRSVWTEVENNKRPIGLINLSRNKNIIVTL